MIVGRKVLGDETVDVQIVGAAPIGSGQLFVASFNLAHEAAETEFRVAAMLSMLHSLLIRSTLSSDDETWIPTFGIRQV